MDNVYYILLGECFLLELILISNNKLKIMMSAEDMGRYDLKCENIDYDNTETRRAFWSILDEAKQRTGFDAASEKVFVQLYPSKGGGCEMYITKLGSGDKGKDSKALSLDTGRRREINIYSFERLEWLCEACARLLRMGYKGDSSLYLSGEGNVYYLLLNEVCDGASSALGGHSVIREFGKAESAVSAGLYIKEYCRCICECGAIERLAFL
jgi:negative regulator of genetic competence, sporulation and motility